MADEKWTTVWVVMHSAKPATIFGPIAGLYTAEDAARKHVATDNDKYMVVEWAASDQFHQS